MILASWGLNHLSLPYGLPKDIISLVFWTVLDFSQSIMPKESQYGGCIKMMLLGKILVCFSKLILNTRCYQRLIKEKLRVK